MTRTLYVRNIEQAAIFLEIDGQLSDGHWENARPHDHWMPWCDAKIVVAAQGQSVGRNFYASRDRYNLLNKDLLDVVQYRMLGIVRIARAFGIEVARFLEHAVDCSKDMVIDWSKPWNQRAFEQVKALGMPTAQSIDAALRDETYTINMMRNDLRDLQSIMRQKVGE